LNFSKSAPKATLGRSFDEGSVSTCLLIGGDPEPIRKHTSRRKVLQNPTDEPTLHHNSRASGDPILFFGICEVQLAGECWPDIRSIGMPFVGRQNLVQERASTERNQFPHERRGCQKGRANSGSIVDDHNLLLKFF
jgi:hypothetical protein